MVYTSIFVKSLTCPQCNEKLEDFELQTQQFSNNNKIDQFFFPDAIEEENCSVEIFASCPYCHGHIKGRLKVKEHLMQKITYWIENCPVFIINASFEDELKNKIKENQTLKVRGKNLSAAIVALILKMRKQEIIDLENVEKLEKMLNLSTEVSYYEKTMITYHPLETTDNLRGVKKYYKVLDKKNEPTKK